MTEKKLGPLKQPNRLPTLFLCLDPSVLDPTFTRLGTLERFLGLPRVQQFFEIPLLKPQVSLSTTLTLAPSPLGSLSDAPTSLQ